MDPNRSTNFSEDTIEHEQVSMEYAESSRLANVDKSELTKLKLSIRNDAEAPIPDIPLEVTIDDPAKICDYIHKTTGVPSKPLFNKDIKVNQIHSEPIILWKYEEEESPKKSRRVSFEASKFCKQASSRRIWEEDGASRNEGRSCSSNQRSSFRSRSRERRSTRSRSFSPREYKSYCPMYRSRNRRRSRSRSKSPRRKSSTSRYQSRSSERRYNFDRQAYRDVSPERSRRSRFDSQSKPGCSHYKSPERRRPRRSRSNSSGKHHSSCPLCRYKDRRATP